MFSPVRLAGCLAVVLLATTASAQTATVRGIVVDSLTQQTLPGATALAERTPDSLRVGAATDLDGSFSLALENGAYTLRVSFVGYQTMERDLRVEGEPLDLGRLALLPDTTLLDDTEVSATRTRVEIRGDTTAFNAEAFSVNPDASAADLVRQLPGVTDGDGTLRADGEVVQRVLVDGKEFFGGDPDEALDALPADAIKEVQVYDKASDQEKLTGFDDGETQQTINLVTKPERRQSLFGRGRAGMGSGARYATEVKANRFDGDRRATLTLRSDNVDRETRSALSEDERPVFFGRGFSNQGVTQTSSIGLNLNDSWGEWAEVSASYSLYGYDRETDFALDREYLLSDAAGQRYTEARDADRASLRHTLSGRAELQLSERTELRLDPRVQFSSGSTDELLNAQTVSPGGDLLSRSQTSSTGDSRDFDLNLRATLGHKFATEGRSLSGSLRLFSDRGSDESLEDIEREFRLAATAPDSLDAFGRRVDDGQLRRQVRGEITYTEPLADGLQILVAYQPSLALRDTDREGLRRDPTGAYTLPDSSFTAVSDRRLVEHEGGAGLQRRTEMITGTLGLGVRHERLTFEQTGTRAFRVERAMTSFAPYARVRFKLGEGNQLDVRYSTSADAPSADQLRDVVDDSNPLRLSGGNPELQTSRSHRAFARYRTADPEAGTSLSFSVNASAASDTIIPATFTAGADSVTVRGVVLPPGAQFTYPVNAGSAWSAFAFAVYGRPVAPLKSNLNTRLTLSYRSGPTLFDGLADVSRSVSGGANFYLTTSGIETLDLSVSYGLNGRVQLSDPSPGSLTHNASLKADWRPGAGWVLTSSTVAAYDPDRERDPLAARLDLGLGYTFLADDEAQVRLTVSDVLDSRANVYRQITDQYIEERESVGLGRVVLLSLSYTLKQR